MLKWLRRLLIAALIVVTVPLGMTLGSAYLSAPCSALQPDAPFEVALVLASGIDRTGKPGPSSALRTEVAVAAWHAGHVERLHFTGTVGNSQPVSTAEAMRRWAEGLGVPREVMTVEDRSRSTLENALLSRPMVAKADSRLVITTGYHLWRSVGSVWWAGMSVDGACMTAPFDNAPLEWVLEFMRLEVIKVWVNLARASLYAGLRAFGQEDRLPDWFLA